MLDLFDILIICVKKKIEHFDNQKHFGCENRLEWGFMGKRRVFPLSKKIDSKIKYVFLGEMFYLLNKLQ